eukprot:tig00020614_g12223.t1
MASGLGVWGLEGRCFKAWNAFVTCVADAEDKGECRKTLADYMECLHQKKLKQEFRENFEKAWEEHQAAKGGASHGHKAHH